MLPGVMTPLFVFDLDVERGHVDNCPIMINNFPQQILSRGHSDI